MHAGLHADAGGEDGCMRSHLCVQLRSLVPLFRASPTGVDVACII